MLERRFSRIHRGVVVTVASGVMTLACSNNTGPNLVRLRVQTLNAPVTASRDAPLTVDVVVERGSCETFDRFDVQRTTSQIVLTAIGTGQPPNVTCTDNIVLQHETYTAPPPFGGSLTVSVQQPDGTLLSQQVAIN